MINLRGGRQQHWHKMRPNSIQKRNLALWHTERQCYGTYVLLLKIQADSTPPSTKGQLEQGFLEEFLTGSQDNIKDQYFSSGKNAQIGSGVAVLLHHLPGPVRTISAVCRPTPHHTLPSPIPAGWSEVCEAVAWLRMAF